MTFEVVERQVIRSLRSRIVQGSLEKPQDLKPSILRRRDGHWATIQLEEYADAGNIYATTYDALDATLDLLSLRQTHDAGFSFASADAMYQAYTTDLFQFDQLYRLFHECADKVELAGWDILKDVQRVVESCYSGWYLDQLSVCRGGLLEGDNGLLQRWAISDIPRQQDFFAHHVNPILKSHPL